MKKIIEQFQKDEKLNLNNISDIYLKTFGVDKIPLFLETKIIEEIKTNQLLKEMNIEKDDDFINVLKRKQSNNMEESLLIYYSQLINKEIQPFEITNNTILYKIFLYSNLKDIYKNPKVKDIFKYNFSEISEFFKYYDVDEFENIINNKKNMAYIDDQLIENCNQYEINDLHIYNLASFFYLIMNVMKDVNELNNCEGNKFINQDNNCNNPLLNKILNNVFISFSLYCPDTKFDYEEYINLINYLNRYIISNGEGEIVNKQYDMKDFEKTIKNSFLFGVSEDLEELKKK